jgi:hypothetical protein
MSFDEITTTTLRLPAADLGPGSPLPSFVGLQRLPDASSSPDLPADMRERMTYGRLANPLPYALQNGYTRELQMRQVPALRLANDRLEAHLLPGLGGRVWSLRDVVTGRDLVLANSRLQFANFALTDAWCAGGIEWNLGSTGHAATTSRPVFAGRVETARGPVLRIWEWERTRDLVFSVDLLLASDRAALLAFVRVRNLDPETKPLYWWTNIAVPERPGVRVLAPTDRAWRTSYDGTLSSVGVPHPDEPGVDVSYPLMATTAADYFFQIPPTRRHWVAAVQADGTGVVQTATSALRGRKLFLWGTGPGGRRWQEWLSGPDRRYLEIQAGLATTQLEHLRLDGGGDLSWAEAYLPLAADPRRCRAGWATATTAVEEHLEGLLRADDLDHLHAWWRTDVADQAPSRQLADGSAAGLAELLVRGIAVEDLAATPFGKPRVDELRHLVDLVETGAVDHEVAGAELLIPPISAHWADAFSGVGEGWWGRLMAAIRAHAAGDLQRAERLYRDSAAMKATAWADRGLAVLASAREHHVLAAALYRDAVSREPDCVPLLVEATEQLLSVGRSTDCVSLIDQAPTAVREHGRVRLQRCRALLAAGALDQARSILDTGIEVPDLREGETLGELWRAAFGDRPLPAHYDFRMVG